MNKQWQEAFDQIHAEDQLKDHTMEYLSRKVYRRRRPRFSPLRGIAAAAAFLAVLFLAGGSWLYFTPEAYISIDINPSLELGINRFDRVVSVEGWNEDGDDLADSLDIKYMDYTDAIETLLSDQVVEDYLSQNGLMDLTVACENTSRHDEILENVESCTSEHTNIRCHSGDMEEMHEAHNEGLSFGKYRAYLKLKELEPSFTADDVRDLSMREIQDLIEEYSDGSSWKPSEDSPSRDDSSGTGASSDTDTSCGYEEGDETGYQSGNKNSSDHESGNENDNDHEGGHGKGYGHGHHE